MQTRRTLLPNRPRPRGLGFSLVELLVAMFILAIGLLGLATMQFISQSQGTGGRHRGTAVMVAHSILDMIQAEGNISAAERGLKGAVTSTGFTYIDPITGASSGTLPASSALTTLPRQFTILGIPTNDSYYTANPTAPKDGIFTVTWRKNAGSVINGNKNASALQEFIVNVSWTEAAQGTSTTTKTISMSRYVRL